MNETNIKISRSSLILSLKDYLRKVGGKNLKFPVYIFFVKKFRKKVDGDAASYCIISWESF